MSQVKLWLARCVMVLGLVSAIGCGGATTTAAPKRAMPGMPGGFSVGEVGRYVPAQSGPDGIVILDTATGELYRATPNDIKPYSARPRGNRYDAEAAKIAEYEAKARADHEAKARAVSEAKERSVFEAKKALDAATKALAAAESAYKNEKDDAKRKDLEKAIDDAKYALKKAEDDFSRIEGALKGGTDDSKQKTEDEKRKALAEAEFSWKLALVRLGVIEKTLSDTKDDTKRKELEKLRFEAIDAVKKAEENLKKTAEYFKK